MALDGIRIDTIPVTSLSFVLLVVLAVPVSPLATPVGATVAGPVTDAPGGATDASPTVYDSSTGHESAPHDNESARPDPESDVLGWERGVWYDEPIDVDQSDGLTEAEEDLLVARTMARVERLRGLEFTDDVDVRFLARSTYQETVVPNTTFGASKTEQLWEATFVWGENEEADAKIRRYLANAVLGYAAEEGVEGITIVTRNGRHVVDEGVLAHELVHVLQDQHYDLSDARYQRDTWDGELAKDGIVEGEAAYLDYLYESRCEGAWNCTDTPSNWSGASVADVGVYPTLSFQPYSDGAVYVGQLVERGGWEAVAAVHREPPTSSEQIVHVTDETPRDLSVADRSADGWTRQQVEVVGEVGLFGMFLQQSRLHPENATIDQSTLRDTDVAYDSLNYSAPPSEGWDGDELVGYSNDTHEGYVWRLAWDSEADARQFAAAYETLLRSYGARRIDERVWRIPETRNGFADAFHVTREGSTVTIVNAPSVRALGDVRTTLRGTLPVQSSTRTNESTSRTTPPKTSTRSTASSGATAGVTDHGSDSAPATGVPGFGALAGLVALAGAAAISMRRQ